jgi:hypothetical protein
MSVEEGARRARRQECVDLACQQQALQRLALRDGDDLHAVGQRQRQPLPPDAGVERAGAPADRLAGHAELVREDAAHPQRGRHLVLRHAHPAPGQVGAGPDARAAPRVEARMAERAAEEGGHGRVGGLAARDLQQVAR